MPIDRNAVQWDDDTIDPAAVQWDNDLTMPDGSSATAAGQRMEADAREYAANRPTAGMSFGQRMAAGAGGVVQDVIDGTKQVGADMGRYFVEQGLGMPAPGLRRTIDQQQQRQAQRRETDADLKTTGGGQLGAFGANVAMTAVPIARVGQVGTAARFATAGGAGATMGGLQPIVAGESRAANAGIGMAAGLVGQGVASGLAASGARASQAVTPEMRATYDAAKRQGVQLMPWQISDSPWMGRARGVASAVPFSGAKGRAAAQSADFQRAAARQFGETLGPDEIVNSHVVGRAADRIGGEFDRLLGTGAKTDRMFLRDIATIRNDARATGNDQAISAANNIIERLRRQGGPVLHGKTVQSLDRQARILAESGDPDRIAVGSDMRSALHRMYARSATPEDAKAFKAARTQYRNLKTIEPIVARQNELVPQQLLGAMNANKRGRTSMARGRAGDMGELARVGQAMKPAQTSGTAENLFSAGALAGGALNLPVTLKALLAGNVGGRALDSGKLADWLMRETRGQTRQRIAPYLLPGAVAATPALVQAKQPRKPSR